MALAAVAATAAPAATEDTLIALYNFDERAEPVWFMEHLWMDPSGERADAPPRGRE